MLGLNIYDHGTVKSRSMFRPVYTHCQKPGTLRCRGEVSIFSSLAGRTRHECLRQSNACTTDITSKRIIKQPTYIITYVCFFFIYRYSGCDSRASNLVYSNLPDGSVIAGSFRDLADAVNAGHDIKVADRYTGMVYPLQVGIFYFWWMFIKLYILHRLYRVI